MNVDVIEKNAGTTSHSALRPGSRIYFHGDPSELAERVQLSAGTHYAAGGVAYGDDAYIPRKPWRRLSAAEIELLGMDGTSKRRGWRPSVDVAVIRIPDELISLFVDMLEERGLRESADPKTYETIASHPRWQQNLTAIGSHLATMCHDRLDAGLDLFPHRRTRSVHINKGRVRRRWPKARRVACGQLGRAPAPAPRPRAQPDLHQSRPRAALFTVIQSAADRHVLLYRSARSRGYLH